MITLSYDELLQALSKPVDPSQLKILTKSGTKLPYIPWHTVIDILDATCVWSFHISHTVTPTQLITSGTLAIETSDCGTVRRSNVGIETLLEWDAKNQTMREIAYGDAASNSYGMCIRRCAVSFGLGRYLYDKDSQQQGANVPKMERPSIPPGKF